MCAMCHKFLIILFDVIQNNAGSTSGSAWLILVVLNTIVYMY